MQMLNRLRASSTFSSKRRLARALLSSMGVGLMGSEGSIGL